MTFQSFITLALLIVNTGVGAIQIRSPAHHSHFSKRATLKNNNNGPCMVPASNANGAKVVVGDCNSAQWTLPSSGSGMIHVFSDKCLDVTDGANKNGAKLQIWTCSGGPNQKFSLTNGQIQFKGTDKCLDLADGKTNNGTPIQLWQCANGNTNQKWSYPAPSGSGSGSGSGSSSGSPISSNIFANKKTKLMLAYPDGNLDELNGLSPAGFFYNWNPTANGLTDTGKTFLPMLWGWNHKAQFDKTIWQSNAPLILGMNECNEPGQSNMSPESGAELWRQSLTPLRKAGRKLCSPAMSGNPNGLKWMKKFSDTCGQDCEFDVVCVHWYDTTAQKFKDWINDWRNLYPGKPILVTEFAPQNFNGGAQPSTGEVWAFYQEVIPWMNSQDDILGYMPYGFMKDLNINQNARLLDWDGKPNALGKWILSQ